MAWEIKVKAVENGYLLSWEEEIKNKVIEKNSVIQIEDCEKEGFVRMVRELQDFFAVPYSKHEPRNIEIKVVENK